VEKHKTVILTGEERARFLRASLPEVSMDEIRKIDPDAEVVWIGDAAYVTTSKSEEVVALIAKGCV
jgi:hypothetical protein